MRGAFRPDGWRSPSCATGYGRGRRLRRSPESEPCSPSRKERSFSRAGQGIIAALQHRKDKVRWGRALAIPTELKLKL